jgi:hypothetical protein
MGASVPDVARLDAALGTLDQVAVTAKLDLASVSDELDFRRLQAAMSKQRDDAVAQILARLRARGGVYANAAERLIYRDALTAWRADPERASLARAVVESGRRVIEQATVKPAAFQDQGVLALCDEVAEAAATVWRVEQDTTMRDTALRLDRRVIDGGKPPASVLRRYSAVAEGAGDVGAALDAWRRLVAALPGDASGWYEARYHSLRLLAVTDPAKAREAMDQHVLLHPDFGPAPWGEKLRELDRTMPRAAAPITPPAPAGGGR